MAEDNLKKLSLINKASAALNSVLDPDKVLDKIISITVELLNLENCAILLFNDETGYLTIHRQKGYRESLVRKIKIKVGEGVTGKVLESGKPAIISDVRKREDYIGECSKKSEMSIPLKTDGNIMGVLDVEKNKINAFTEEDLRYLTIFSHHAAVALNNAKLHDELKAGRFALMRKVKELSTLNKVAEKLNSILYIGELLREILNLLNDVLKFSRSAILLLDGEKGELTIKAAYRYKKEVTRNFKIKVGEGITGWVAKTGEPELVSDVKKDPRYIEGIKGGRCTMAVPLKVRNQVVGVLNAESTKVGAFTKKDLELFSTFAAQAAVAIYNAELYGEIDDRNRILNENVFEIQRMNQELREYSKKIKISNINLEKRMRELRTLYEAGKAMTKSLDFKDTMESIVNMTKDIIKANVGVVRLFDRDTNKLKFSAAYDYSKDLVIMDGDGRVPRLSKSKVKSFVDIPLQIGNKKIGVFEIGSTEVQSFTEDEKRMLHTLASQAAIAIENARLFEEIQRTYYETIKSLVHALEARDSYTRGHSERVTKYALLIADKMDIEKEERKILSYAGILHDIGKIGISDAILNKPTKLTAKEWEKIESHPYLGDSILGPIKFLKKTQTVILHHHERYDGKGYPGKLKGRSIPVGSRIISVCDAYDAMTSTRTYRNALSKGQAIGELKKNAGTQFDPKIVGLFLEIMKQCHRLNKIQSTKSK